MIDVVNKFNMVDMGGIDIVESQGVAVDGLFSRLLTAIQNCRYQILYNWKFAKIEIAPSYVELVFDGTRIYINEAVSVTEDDVVHIYSLEPEPVEPVLIPITITKNGQYNPLDYKADGFSGVDVNVPKGDVYKGFELYTASSKGGQESDIGILNNNYLVCFFHDNMGTSYTANSENKTFTVTQGGYYTASIRATTIAITNPERQQNNGFIVDRGTLFTTSHDDFGSYMSLVGGWVGYGAGRIYENGSSGTANVISIEHPSSTLLIFAAGSSTSLAGKNTLSINGVEKQAINTGAWYDGVYNLYGAYIIDNNETDRVEIQFPASCFNYVSVVALY